MKRSTVVKINLVALIATILVIFITEKPDIQIIVLSAIALILVLTAIFEKQ